MEIKENCYFKKPTPEQVAFWCYARKYQEKGNEWTPQVSDAAVRKFNYSYISEDARAYSFKGKNDTEYREVR
jgi:hypothetical protein